MKFIEIKTGITLVNEWSQIGKKMAWYDITLISIRAEINKVTENYEADFVLCGVGFTACWWPKEKRDIFLKKHKK